MVDKFGQKEVKRGNKAIKILGNTNRVEADVVATFEHRRYSKNKTFKSGTGFDTDDYDRIQNWPKQHISNGITKNSDTHRRFKRVVRIFKKLNYEMKDNNIAIANKIPSFLIECLIWNVPNSNFNNYDSWTDRVKECISYLFHNTKTDEDCKDWGEVSELLYLFVGRSWTRTEVNDWLKAAWNYLELGND